MIITITQNEITKAIAEYLQNNYKFSSENLPEVKFIAGRGEEGYRATIDFSSSKEVDKSEPTGDSSAVPARNTKQAKRGRPSKRVSLPDKQEDLLGNEPDEDPFNLSTEESVQEDAEDPTARAASVPPATSPKPSLFKRPQ